MLTSDQCWWLAKKICRIFAICKYTGFPPAARMISVIMHLQWATAKETALLATLSHCDFIIVQLSSLTIPVSITDLLSPFPLHFNFSFLIVFRFVLHLHLYSFEVTLLGFGVIFLIGDFCQVGRWQIGRKTLRKGTEETGDAENPFNLSVPFMPHWYDLIILLHYNHKKLDSWHWLWIQNE